MIALAISEIGAIAQRRVALMVDPTLSFDLPPFLTPDPGLNSGFMIAEVTTAALMSENKHLANPCVTDSTPTSANQEDHVSMAAHGASRLQPMIANLEPHPRHRAALRRPGRRVPRTAQARASRCKRVLAALRERVPPLGQDRFLAPDLDAAAELIAADRVVEAADAPMPALAP